MVYQFQLPSIIYFQEPVLVTIIMKVVMTEDALWWYCFSYCLMVKEKLKQIIKEQRTIFKSW